MNLYLLILLLIAVIFYYVFKRILPQSINHLKIKSWLLSIITIPILLVLIILTYFTIIIPSLKTKDFNSELWKSDANSRYKMINDITKKKNLIGKTKSEVIKLLGTDFKENCYGKNTICYLAYQPDDWGIDHTEFVVFFNKNGIVTRATKELI